MAGLGLTYEHLEMVREYPHLLGHLAGRDLLTPLHSDWIRYIWEGGEEHRAIQAHRGSRKTTAVAAVGSMWWMLFNPDSRNAIIRKTFSDAAEVVTAVGHMMDQPPIKELFTLAHGHAPKAKIRRYGCLEYNFKNTITQEKSLTAHGLDASITGKHYDKILTDDIITLKDRISRAERERTKEIVRELVTNIIDPGLGVGFIGTPWHEDDAWQVVPCEPLRFPVDACGILSPDEIERKKKLTTPFLYAANYELELQADESTLFQDPQFKPWTWRAPCQMHLDTAFDGDHYCALTVMSPSSPGQPIQATGWVYPGNVRDWYPKIIQLVGQYRPSTLWVEDNADKGHTTATLKRMGAPARGYAESQNKHVKISTCLYDVWPRIHWSAETDQEYLAQITDYREGGEPDDAPDSAATLSRIMFGPVKSVKSALWTA